MFEVSAAELSGLEYAMGHSAKPYVRRQATALWNLGQGKTSREVSGFLKVSTTSLGKWQKRYKAEGLAGLELKLGRGRPRVADPEEIETYLRQSPRQFGLSETRWSLSTLTLVVPSLKGFSTTGVWRALRRYGLSYKRGQPVLHSPDPQYDQKRGLEGSASRSL